MSDHEEYSPAVERAAAKFRHHAMLILRFQKATRNFPPEKKQRLWARFQFVTRVKE